MRGGYGETNLTSMLEKLHFKDVDSISFKTIPPIVNTFVITFEEETSI
jgi:hypothetical protein